jgi:hypothetical protein
MRLALEYIAAFLDCDGSICIVHSRRQNRRDEYYAKANFYSQNLDVLYEIRDIIGGKITPPNTGMVHTLQLSPKTTIAALKVLLPYLRIKREQALTVLELEKVNRSVKKVGRVGNIHGGQEPVPDYIFEQRIALCDKIRCLNHKDSQAFRKNRVKSGEPSEGEAIPSQATEGIGSVEGVTTREVSPNNNPLHETPTGNGRDSLSSVYSCTIQ